MEEQEKNRLMLQFEHLLRKTNKDNINPVIDSLSIDDLEPIISLVARCRARYLAYVHDISKKYEGTDDFPNAEEMEKLRKLRVAFDELTSGSQAFETSILRGYLDVKG